MFNAIRNASSTFHVFYTFMYLIYFLSLYPFAVSKPDFLYETASLQWVGGGGGGAGTSVLM